MRMDMEDNAGTSSTITIQLTKVIKPKLSAQEAETISVQLENIKNFLFQKNKMNEERKKLQIYGIPSVMTRR